MCRDETLTATREDTMAARVPEIGEEVYLTNKKGVVKLRVESNTIGGWLVSGVVLASSFSSEMVGKRISGTSRSRLQYAMPDSAPRD